jgi:hypothetical protein
MSWETFLKAHRGEIAATDFFSVEVLTRAGLVRYLVLFVIVIVIDLDLDPSGVKTVKLPARSPCSPSAELGLLGVILAPSAHHAPESIGAFSLSGHFAKRGPSSRDSNRLQYRPHAITDREGCSHQTCAALMYRRQSLRTGEEPLTTPTLSKSRYLAARQCHKRLWLSVHQSNLATETESGVQSIIDAGTEVGRAAHALFPGGTLVDEDSAHFDEAITRTATLLADTSVPAIFEAAFEHQGVRIRVDVLERLVGGAFGLREVKSSTRAKDAHEPDLAIQLWVLRGIGLDVPSAEVVRINKDYVRTTAEIDWVQFFVRVDLTNVAEETFDRVSSDVPAMHQLLEQSDAPVVEPGPHCNKPHTCEFWSHCTSGKSAEWIVGRKGVKAELKAHWLEAAKSGRPWVSKGLATALAPAEPPVWYLDFEALVPAMPLYQGTSPYEALPFQWSLHHLGEDDQTSHHEFLARGDSDPRSETAESLLDVLSHDDLRVVVYSPYESQMLKKMAKHLPHLAVGLERLRHRLFDLLPVVRGGVYVPEFAGSLSIKKVAPALAPHVRYDDLEDVAEGIGAASAFARLAAGLADANEARRTRAALLAYCKRDTLALMEVHQAMRGMVEGVAL